MTKYPKLGNSCCPTTTKIFQIHFMTQNWGLMGIYDPKLGSASTCPPVLRGFTPRDLLSVVLSRSPSIHSAQSLYVQ